jgi:hypothetical protein
VNAAWQEFSDELARWRDAGRTVEFWWRDDDAAQATPALARLLALAQRSATPLALAVIPARFEAEAFAAAGPTISLLQHGTDHRNRGAPGEKKTEFPAAEPAAVALARLALARERLAAHPRFLPVLAPPWNRLPEPLAAQLAAAGFQGLSRYGARAGPLAGAGVAQVNTHVDLIAWRAGRGFAGDAPCLQAAVRHLAAKREARADAGEATGWLSHHGVHDDGAWAFLERLLETTRQLQGVRWRGAPEIFHAP